MQTLSSNTETGRPTCLSKNPSTTYSNRRPDKASCSGAVRDAPNSADNSSKRTRDSPVLPPVIPCFFFQACLVGMLYPVSCQAAPGPTFIAHPVKGAKKTCSADRWARRRLSPPLNRSVEMRHSARQPSRGKLPPTDWTPFDAERFRSSEGSSRVPGLQYEWRPRNKQPRHGAERLMV